RVAKAVEVDPRGQPRPCGIARRVDLRGENVKLVRECGPFHRHASGSYANSMPCTGPGRRNASVERLGPPLGMPAFLQATVNGRRLRLAISPSPRIRLPNADSLSFPPRTPRMRLSTLSLRSGKCWVSHFSNRSLTA